MNKEKLTDLIRLSSWGTGTVVADRDIYEEMKQQTIAVLPADCLSSLGLSHELLHEWKKHILEQLVLYDHYLHEQTNLPISVPYIVLKGTAAAQYYPHPEYPDQIYSNRSFVKVRSCLLRQRHILQIFQLY